MKAMTAALGLVLALAPATVRAATMTIPMNLITDRGVGAPIGNVRAEDTGAGLKLTPELAGLPPGRTGSICTRRQCAHPERTTAGCRRDWPPVATGTRRSPANTWAREDRGTRATCRC